MCSNSMNNSEKFRFVGATAKQSNMYDTQLPSQPADPKRKNGQIKYFEIEKLNFFPCLFLNNYLIHYNYKRRHYETSAG